MAYLRNLDLVRQSERIIGGRQGEQVDPVLGELTPVIVINPPSQSWNGNRSTTGTTTILTTPADADFYCTGVLLCCNCDAAADTTLYDLKSTINGATVVLARFRKNSLATASKELSIQFVNPILLDRSAAVTVQQSFTVGTSTVDGTVFGFITNS